jgi:glycosyltransferase involved in cell wall biosynthesis
MVAFQKRQVFAAVVIPCFNDKGRLAEVLKTIAATIKEPLAIVVVDDGSSAQNKIRMELLREISELGAPRIELYLLRHLVNLGQGAALETGFSFIRERLKAGAILTMDADGQHDPADIEKFLKPVCEGRFDIVFGNRFHNQSRSNVPTLRRYILNCAVWFEAAITGVKLSDSHNGFRCLSPKALEVMKLRQSRMAHATEVKLITSREKLNYTEVPTTIKYSSETLAKGQSNFGALVILRDLARAYLFE